MSGSFLKCAFCHPMAAMTNPVHVHDHTNVPSKSGPAQINRAAPHVVIAAAVCSSLKPDMISATAAHRTLKAQALSGLLGRRYLIQSFHCLTFKPTWSAQLWEAKTLKDFFRSKYCSTPALTSHTKGHVDPHSNFSDVSLARGR